MASMFFEVSTRTSCSFSAAMQRLGGSVISLDFSMSSLQKGESFSDSVMMMSGYSDVIVIRHPTLGVMTEAVNLCKRPIISRGWSRGTSNAGFSGCVYHQRGGRISRRTDYNHGRRSEKWPHCPFPGSTVDSVQGQYTLRVSGFTEDA
ncbi:CAD protein-like [Saccostrea cucullata]|uniref:CAD protein-like n=1 Tax=Saccostrea cuccullata TaxID=36930 RepID=UPI002ED6B37F